MGEGNGTRVSTQEFYQQQLKIQEDMNRGFEQMNEKLSLIRAGMSALDVDVRNNKEEIRQLRTHSNKIDVIIGFVTAVGTGIGAFFGLRN